MPIAIEQVLVGVSLLLLLSVLASKVSDRFGVPALLLFLVLGMLAGSEGFGGIHFDDPALAQLVGVIALTLILFSGGLDTEWKAIRPVLKEGLALSTLGVLITALIVGGLAVLLLGFSFLEGMLLGATVSSTDAAAVFSVLRSKGVALRGKLRALLELESGSNDPMAVFLTVGVLGLLTRPATSLVDLLLQFLIQMVLGTVVGYGMGMAVRFLANRLRLGYDGLYPVLTLAAVLLTYGLASTAGGNGFLAVYVAGLFLGRHEFVHKRSILRFHDGMAWLMQIAMFLTLGLLVFPSRLLPVVGVGLLIAAGLILVARPAAVFIGLLASTFDWREKTFVSWVGLRGAVPIVLATYPLLAGIARADVIFNIVFFVVLASVMVQGTSVPRVARWLRVDAAPSGPVSVVDRAAAGGLRSELRELRIAPGSSAVGKTIVELGLPPEFLIVLIARGGEFVLPTGGMTLQAGDTLLAVSDDAAFRQVQSRMDSGAERG